MGKIALVAYGNCSVEKHLEYVIKAGAKGMLLVGDGWRTCMLIDQHPYNTSIPTICVNAISSSFKSFSANFSENIKNKKATLIDFTPGINPYDELNKPAMEFKRIFILTSSSLLIVLSIYQLVQFFMIEKKQKYIICILFSGLICIHTSLFYF
eukprot:TRINITY_DN9467_c0_g1_i1.p1 TRINITY_DN9467_c0_g1~~TRINITY_DN9467_c0_g1_i1.p1  ORF type:complete len:153 (-),score=15.52 TRINITY_DN9467_c0_g1_i1:593-1051(-)